MMATELIERLTGLVKEQPTSSRRRRTRLHSSELLQTSRKRWRRQQPREKN